MHMEENIQNYSTNVMFRETPCIFINNLQTIKIILLKTWLLQIIGTKHNNSQKLNHINIIFIFIKCIWLLPWKKIIIVIDANWIFSEVAFLIHKGILKTLIRSRIGHLFFQAKNWVLKYFFFKKRWLKQL